MLIINIILFISAICSGTNIAIATSVTSVTSIKSKREVVDPDYNTRNNQEQSRRTQAQPRISPQDINSRSLPHYTSAKATDTKRVSYANPNQGSVSYAYGSVPKRPLSYVPSSIYQTESLRNSPLAPYFDLLNNPNTYNVATSAEKPLDVSKSIVPLQKVQGTYSPSYNAFHQDKPIELSGFSDFEYPSYASISKLISQNSGSAPIVQVPVYKTSYPLSKVTEYANIYAPSFPTVSNHHQNVQDGTTSSSNKTTQNSNQKDEATIDVNGKKISVPIIQLQSNQDFSGVLPVFESQPFLLSSNYPTASDLGFNFEIGPKFNMALQSKNVSPFSSPMSSFQGQVVPIRTASSSPQFPQYKGASIEAFPVPNNVPKAQGSYEPLYSQPQLHFGKEHRDNVRPINIQQNIVHPTVSMEDILEDAEIINPKNPEPHRPQPDDDDREDERYRNPENEYDNSKNDEAERQSVKHFKEPPTESDFKPSTSFPFKEYDERFGKHRSQNNDEDSEDKPYPKYKNYSSSDKDEEEENSSSEYRAEYAESPKSSHNSYEEEDEDKDEEETRKNEKREEADEDSSEVEPKQSKYYEKDFEQEFEESYREELPKQEYVHVKEVPEIDSYNNPKPSRRQQRGNNPSRVNHEQFEEPRIQESRTSRRNRKIPKTDYRDSASYGSNISAKKAPKVIYEELFEYKNPETGKYSKNAKTEDAIEEYSPTQKLPKEDSYLRAAKYYKFKNSKTRDGLNSKDKDPYFSAKNWKSGKNSPEKTVLRSIVRQLPDPDDGVSFYGPSVVSGQVRSLTNAEILRHLTGI